MHTEFLSEILNGRDHSEDLDVVGKIILKRIFGNWVCGLDAHDSG
jgi:hypothetical protein